MSYSKGARYERELIEILSSKFIAYRIAGSGKYNKPDIIAGNQRVLLLIECKSTRKRELYIDKQEAYELLKQAKKLGALPFYAIKFIGRGWRLIPAKLLLDKNKVTVEHGVDVRAFLKKL